MRHVIVSIVLICALPLINPTGSLASWLIDGERFHASVHGQMSCLDCHQSVKVQKTHPDPNTVNQTLNDFFSVDQCVECHDNVVEEIESGRHGGLKDIRSESQKHCIDCHDPHATMGSSNQQVDFTAPGTQKCAVCHEYQPVLPEPSDNDASCFACHLKTATPSKISDLQIRQLCFYCHGTQGVEGGRFKHGHSPLIDMIEYAGTPHSELSCLLCHTSSAGFNHSDQPIKDCEACHLRHDEKTIHDPHVSVSCQACHFEGGELVKDSSTGRIVWESSQALKSRVHHMKLSGGEKSCSRCHFSGNAVGAAANILPAKGVFCMPCHSASFSVNDPVTLTALIFFVIGTILLVSYLFSGVSRGEIKERAVTGKQMGYHSKAFQATFSAGIGSVFKVLILEGFFQRRLFHRSRARWLVHGLVFYPFVLRFSWGVLSLAASAWAPQWMVLDVLQNKNHLITAFVFDLTGCMMLFGLLLFVWQRGSVAKGVSVDRIQRFDRLAFILLAGLIVVGFILEGMRIAMTGTPPGAPYAFIGYFISRLLPDADFSVIYGWVWYAHAILTGCLVIYLPFSRMRHIILTPLVLLITSFPGHDHHQGETPRKHQ